MKCMLRAALPALALFAAAGPVRAIGFDNMGPYKVEAGANIYFRVHRAPSTQGQLGPWYLYWPLEAHFQMPAPLGYPGYATPQALPPGFQAPVPQQLPPFKPPVPTPQPQFQPPAPTPANGGFQPPPPTPVPGFQPPPPMPVPGNGGR